MDGRVADVLPRGRGKLRRTASRSADHHLRSAASRWDRCDGGCAGGVGFGFSLGVKHLSCLVEFGLLSYIFGPLDEHLG